MSKLVEKDGKFYRMRRGVLVEIPEEWVGNTTRSQTIRKRPSKAGTKKRRRDINDSRWKRTRKMLDAKDDLRTKS